MGFDPFSKFSDNLFMDIYSTLKSRSTKIQSLDAFNFWIYGSLSQSESDNRFLSLESIVDGGQGHFFKNIF